MSAGWQASGIRRGSATAPGGERRGDDRTQAGEPVGENRALRAALVYARRGWPVFPCRPGEKTPATEHGFLNATTDTEQIAAWWKSAPQRNVAIATGAPGPDVLDIDVRETGSGFAALNRLKRAGLAGDPHAIVRTPSGGIHLYFKGTAQRNGHVAAQHVDFRGQGGYILASPSAVGGRPYVVVSHGTSQAVLDWGKVMDLLDPQHERERPAVARGTGREWDGSRLAAWVAAQVEGNRNQGLFWASMRVIEAGHADALDDLVRAAQVAGLTEAEALRTVRSAQRRAVRSSDWQRMPGSGRQGEAVP
ncbi:MAG: bifunctional DNA primase/polymerase [Streptosporangiaceae bacterium]